MEMRTLSEKTGGYTVMNEEFNSDVFKQTYKKIFDLDPETNLLKVIYYKYKKIIFIIYKIINICILLKKRWELLPKLIYLYQKN